MMVVEPSEFGEVSGRRAAARKSTIAGRKIVVLDVAGLARARAGESLCFAL